MKIQYDTSSIQFLQIWKTNFFYKKLKRQLKIDSYYFVKIKLLTCKTRVVGHRDCSEYAKFFQKYICCHYCSFYENYPLILWLAVLYSTQAQVYINFQNI